MQDEQTARLQTGVVHSRVLDRRFDLTAIPVEIVAWAGLFIVVAAIRLTGRTNWPLSPFESTVARDALAWVYGSELSAGAATYPFLIQLTALSFFLFGDTDYTARLVPLLASLLGLAVIFRSRKWIGALPAFSIGVIWTVSPVMTMNASRIDGMSVVLLAGLIAMSVIVSLAHRPSTTDAAILGASLGFMVTVHPVGWVFLGSTLAASLLVLGRAIRSRELSAAGTSFAVTLALSTSWLMTRPQMVLDYLIDNPTSLWSDYLIPAGGHWAQMLLVLLTDELPAFLMTLAGLTLLARNWRSIEQEYGRLALAGVVWGTPLVGYGFLSETGSPGAYAVAVLPFVVFGGFGLAATINRFRLGAMRPLQITVGALAAAGFIVALFRLIDLLSGGPGEQSIRWILNVLALGVLILTPLGYLMFRRFGRTPHVLLPTILIGILILLVLVAIRSSLLLSSVDTQRSGQILTAGSTAPAVSIIERRLTRYSLDATTYVQDVRDPAGGHGLVIVIDERVADPFAWYYRNFPDAQVVSNAGEFEGDEPPDAVFALPEDGPTYIRDLEVFYRSREYALTYTLPDSLARGRAGRSLFEMLVPGMGRNYSDYLIYRRTDDPFGRTHFTLLLREEHAHAIWGE